MPVRQLVPARQLTAAPQVSAADLQVARENAGKPVSSRLATKSAQRTCKSLMTAVSALVGNLQIRCAGLLRSEGLQELTGWQELTDLEAGRFSVDFRTRSGVHANRAAKKCARP